MSVYATHVSGLAVNTTVVQTLDTNVTAVRYSAPYNVTRVTEGLPGPAGAAASGYNHTQASAVTVWTINHNLGFKPSVQALTVGGLEVLGEVQHVSSNQVTITFNTAIAGTARLS